MSRFDQFDDNDTYSFQSPPDPPRAPEVNPYAAPAYVPHEAELNQSPGGPVVPVPTAVRFMDVVHATWSVYRVNKMNTCVAVIAMGVLAAIFNAVVNAIFGPVTVQVTPEMVRQEAHPVANILANLFQIWLSIGLFRTLTAIARGEGRQDRLLFSGGNAFLKVLGFQILMGLIAMPLILLAAIPMIIGMLAVGSAGGGIMMVVSVVCIVVVAIFISAAIWPGTWLLTDKEIGVMDTIRTAFSIMFLNFGTVFLLTLWAFLLIVLGLLMLIIGVFWTGPLAWLTFVVFCMMSAGERVGANKWGTVE